MKITQVKRRYSGRNRNFLFHVFDVTLQTDMCKMFFCKLTKAKNVQIIWTEFLLDARASTKGQIAVVIRFVAHAKFDNKFNGTSTNFLLYWQNKLGEYESYLTKPEEFYTDSQKLAMLQNIVDDVPELHHVRTNADHNVAAGLPALTNDLYTPLLLSAASAFDKVANGQPFKTVIRPYFIPILIINILLIILKLVILMTNRLMLILILPTLQNVRLL